MLLRKLYSGLLLCFFVIAPCWAEDAPVPSKALPEAASHHLSNPAKPILVRSASPAFAIHLAADASTGYQWFLSDYNPRFVKFLSQEYTTGQAKQIGSKGISTWQFQLQQVAFAAPQVTTVALEYRRAWESKAVKRQVFTVLTQ